VPARILPADVDAGCAETPAFAACVAAAFVAAGVVAGVEGVLFPAAVADVAVSCSVLQCAAVCSSGARFFWTIAAVAAAATAVTAVTAVAAKFVATV